MIVERWRLAKTSCLGANSLRFMRPHVVGIMNRRRQRITLDLDENAFFRVGTPETTTHLNVDLVGCRNITGPAAAANEAVCSVVTCSQTTEAIDDGIGHAYVEQSAIVNAQRPGSGS